MAVAFCGGGKTAQVFAAIVPIQVVFDGSL